MTNFEYFKDEIVRIKAADNFHAHPAVSKYTGEPMMCRDGRCDACVFGHGKCNLLEFYKWCAEEHIGKPKLTKKERQFCELVETGCIYRNHDGSLYWHGNVPEAEHIYKDTVNDFKWVGVFGCQMVLNRFVYQPKLNFSFITWDDKEPWSVEELLNLEVMEG